MSRKKYNKNQKKTSKQTNKKSLKTYLKAYIKNYSHTVIICELKEKTQKHTHTQANRSYKM